MTDEVDEVEEVALGEEGEEADLAELVEDGEDDDEDEDDFELEDEEDGVLLFGGGGLGRLEDVELEDFLTLSTMSSHPPAALAFLQRRTRASAR